MNVDFKLLDISEESFSFNDFQLTRTEAKKNLLIGIGFEPGVDLEKKLFALDFVVNYVYKPTDKKLLFLKYKFIFKINEIHKVVNKLDKAFEIDDDFLALVLDVAIGTLRGVIIAKTSGRDLNKFFLPLFDPYDLIQMAEKDLLNENK